MQIGMLLVFAGVFSLIFAVIQRSQQGRRRWITFISLVPLELMRRLAWYRDAHTEAWVGLAFALFLNLFFWLFIGRYNPPPGPDEIKVLKMND